MKTICSAQSWKKRSLFLSLNNREQIQFPVSLSARVIIRSPTSWNSSLWISVGEKDNPPSKPLSLGKTARCRRYIPCWCRRVCRSAHLSRAPHHRSGADPLRPSSAPFPTKPPSNWQREFYMEVLLLTGENEDSS